MSLVLMQTTDYYNVSLATTLSVVDPLSYSFAHLSSFLLYHPPETKKTELQKVIRIDDPVTQTCLCTSDVC